MDSVDQVIRVLVVDDDPLVRSALSLMLGGQSDIEMVGEAADGVEVPALVRKYTPDVVLMDIRMPKVDGLDATRQLAKLPDAPRVIVLTTFGLDDYIVDALGAGADGFLLKDTPPAEIVAAVRSVAGGDPMLSPAVTRSLIERVRIDRRDDDGRSAAATSRLDRLTERELEVALAIGRGLSNADIARSLYLSVPTVKAHVSKLFEKLDATNRVQIAICVHDAGLL